MILYKVVLNLEYLTEMLKCDHYYPAVLFIRLQKIVQTSKTADGILVLKRKLLCSYFLWYCLLCTTRCF